MARSHAAWTLLSGALALGAIAAGLHLTAGRTVDLTIPLHGPLGELRISADPLSGVFVLVSGLVGLAATWWGHRRHESTMGHATLFAFLAGLFLVPLAGDVFTLVVAWELMSASPGLLLILDARHETRKAGLLYLVYAHLSATCLLIGLLVWGSPASSSLETLLARPPPLLAAAFILAGAVIKSGLMPFHAWLPEAHPAAPSHISALMSGAMVAQPVYLVLRLLAPFRIEPWLGSVVLLLAGLSAALGALHALHARNLKRVLALTTIAHMGSLYVVLATALLLDPGTHAAAHAYLESAALAYLFAHGLAKASLFLIAGEVHHAAHELDLEQLGGLWREMPALAALALVGAAALAALPPMAGFPAEIGLFAALFSTLRTLDPVASVSLLGILFLLGLGAGAGLAAVAKIALGAFHGARRGPARPPSHDRGFLGPILLLAGASLVLGLFPGLLWRRLPAGAPDALTLPTPFGPLVLLPIVLAATGLLLVLFLLLRPQVQAPARVDPWNCGAPPPGPQQTYSPQGLVMPYRILFAEILRPASDLNLQEAPVAPFAPAKGRYEDPSPRFIEPWIHEPVRRSLRPATAWLRRIHYGSVHTYLLIALATFLLLLFLFRVVL